jgi:hypothetical protein
MVCHRVVKKTIRSYLLPRSIPLTNTITDTDPMHAALLRPATRTPLGSSPPTPAAASHHGSSCRLDPAFSVCHDPDLLPKQQVRPAVPQIAAVVSSPDQIWLECSVPSRPAQLKWAASPAKDVERCRMFGAPYRKLERTWEAGLEDL